MRWKPQGSCVIIWWMAAKAATKLTLLLIECKVMGKIYTINTFLSFKKKIIDISGEDSEQFIELPSCFCSIYRELKVKKSKTCFWWQVRKAEDAFPFLGMLIWEHSELSVEKRVVLFASQKMLNTSLCSGDLCIVPATMCFSACSVHHLLGTSALLEEELQPALCVPAERGPDGRLTYSRLVLFLSVDVSIAPFQNITTASLPVLF